MVRRRTVLVATVALAAAGCGSGATTGGVVARAARATSTAAGYRLAGVVTIAAPMTGTLTELISGSFDRRAQAATLRTTALLAGRTVRISERISKLVVYMDAAAIPDGLALTGGKPWIKIDASRAAGAIGLSALPTASDPTQFVDYLRAVSSSTSGAGAQRIRGVPARRYRANVDLDRYPSLVAAAQRPAVARAVGMLESVLGSHTLPLEVWIDAHGLVRRLSLAFNECVVRTRFRFSLTMDLYDYGPQPPPAIPPAGEVYDVTKVIRSSLRHAKLACA